MKKYILVNVFILFSFLLKAQNQNVDSSTIRSIFDFVLTQSECYKNLDYLCNKIGPRLSGSDNAKKAVDYTADLMKQYEFDNVYLQEVIVPHWVRGDKEKAEINVNKERISVNVCALGGSIATPSKGLKAQVIEVKSFDELKSLGKEKIQGKWVFFNCPMNPTYINTFKAYGEAVKYRFNGAVEAAKYDAVGVIVRSLSLRIDEHPHTGQMQYGEDIEKIPAIAISTLHADLLSKKLKEDSLLEFFCKTSCKILPNVLSHNVMGEIKGSEFPNEIILVGAHLDSWDLGTGAHDDGAGCVQSMEVLHIFKQLGLKPKRTIRVVLFMNEENGLRGGKKYAEIVAQNKEKHLVAIETDDGGFTPKGFSIDGKPNHVEKISAWKSLLGEYGLNDIGTGGGGADISPLKGQGVTLISLKPDSQRYFDVHHACTDRFEMIDKRELELGAASIASLIYLIDQYGL